MILLERYILHFNSCQILLSCDQYHFKIFHCLLWNFSICFEISGIHFFHGYGIMSLFLLSIHTTARLLFPVLTVFSIFFIRGYIYNHTTVSFFSILSFPQQKVQVFLVCNRSSQSFIMLRYNWYKRVIGLQSLRKVLLVVVWITKNFPTFSSIRRSLLLSNICVIVVKVLYEQSRNIPLFLTVVLTTFAFTFCITFFSLFIDVYLVVYARTKPLFHLTTSIRPVKISR